MQHCLAVYDKFRHINILLLYTVLLPVAVQSNVNIYTISPSLQVCTTSSVQCLHYIVYSNNEYTTSSLLQQCLTICLFQQCLHYIVCYNNVHTTSSVRTMSTLHSCSNIVDTTSCVPTMSTLSDMFQGCLYNVVCFYNVYITPSGPAMSKQFRLL